MNATYLLQEFHDLAVDPGADGRSRRAGRVAIEEESRLAFGLPRTLEADGYEIFLAGDESLGVPIVIIAPHDATTDVTRGTASASGGEITGPLDLAELLTHIRAFIPRGGHPQTGGPELAEPRPDESETRDEDAQRDQLRFGDVRIDVAANLVTKRGRRVALTPKELDLLVAFVRHPGEVLSRAMLLREVWGHRAEVVTRTVDMHVVELRRKLEDVPASPRHFVTVWKRGYRFDP